MMKSVVRLLTVAVVAALVASCSLDSLSFLKKKTEQNVVAEVGDDVLTMEEIHRSLRFDGMSEGDSLLLVDAYVKNWISDKLLYNKAVSEVDDIEEIDSLVENYRRSLVIYEYERALVQDRLTDQMSEAQIRVYYKENPSLFILSEPMLTGMILTSYSDVPDLSTLEALMMNPSEDNLDLISSICVKNAAKFEHFANRWLPLSEIQKSCPLQIREKDLKSQQMTTFKDSMYTVFLYVNDFKSMGDQQPFEYAKGRIQSILTEQNKNAFLQTYRKSLYETGIQKGQAKRFK